MELNGVVVVMHLGPDELLDLERVVVVTYKVIFI